MALIDKAKGKIIPNAKEVHHRWSFQISTFGAGLGALGAGLAAGTSAANMAPILPEWAVWAGGALICACVSVAMYIKQKPKPDYLDGFDRHDH